MHLLINNDQTTLILSLLTLAIIVCLYIFLNWHKRLSLTDPASISPVIFKMLDEAIIIINNSKKIEYFNDKASLLLIQSKNVLLGKSISEILPDLNFQDISVNNEINISMTDDKKITVSVHIVKLMGIDLGNEGYGIILKQTNENDERKAGLQKKIIELTEKNKILDNEINNLEKDKLNVDQKVSESTLNLREEHARLYSSINNIGFGFIMTDNDKNIIMINKTAKNLFLIPQTETNIKLNDLQLSIKGKLNITESMDESQNNNNTLAFTDIQIGDKYTNIFISPIVITRNNKLQAIGNVIMIDDKTTERLIKRSKNNFFIIASHELRTPLTGIKGYIAIIKQLYFEKIKDDGLKRIINDIDTSSSRLINIVNDFLATSIPEQNKIVVNSEVCDLIGIINATIKETRSIAIEKKLYFNFINPSFNEALVSGDKDKLKQILINLISNSIKYTDHGGITISIEIMTEGLYKILIKDTGRGISPDNIKLLFSKFQRFDPDRPANIISSGLGLYISRILAEKMHGTVNLVYSKEGEGSGFSFTMPAYKGSNDRIAITNMNELN